ncbi:MAG: MiaB/RimO family radical SAM methylthiotransferase, partial [Candidatus Gracilibacteria bacterium]|nr:MiaB/RimO family radical SAM methylthiotransferase [Candidatus Gracilibacteria bacterium]
LKDKKGVFVASCVVTDKAKSKWIKFVKDEIKKLKEDEKVYISGCGSIKNGNVDKEFYSNYKELESLKDKIVILGEEPKDDFGDKVKSIKDLFVKKFLVIQTGCDNFCTFCLTVSARGGHKSRQKEEIIDEINDFLVSGGKEVVLTGINLGAWGASSSNEFKNSKFCELLEEILQKTKIERLKISSLGVEFLDDRLFEILKSSRICPHFHLSIQSGSDKILSKMNRHYDRAKIIRVLDKFKNLKRENSVPISIGADFIIGFPGETEHDFLDTFNLVKDFGISKVHAFTFSPHFNNNSQVPAGKMHNQIDEKIKKERYLRLMKLADEVRFDFKKSNVGKKLKLLVEKVNGDKFSGWSENYIELNETNFLSEEKDFKKGNIVDGIYDLD